MARMRSKGPVRSVFAEVQNQRRIEIDPVGFGFGKLSVGSDCERWDRKTEWRAAPRGEQDQCRARRDQSAG